MWKHRGARISALLTLLLCVVALPLHGGALDYSVIGLFPANVHELGYVDLNQARSLPWFKQFETQFLPVPLFGFEQFLAAAQMRQSSPVDSVAWARVPETDDASSQGSGQQGPLVGVLRGDFSQMPAFLDTQKPPSVVLAGGRAYSSGTGSAGSDIFFTVIDPNTMAFGPIAALRRMMSTQRGDQATLLANEKLMALVSQVNGSGILWVAFDSSGASGLIHALAPAAGAFPQAEPLIAKTQGSVISVSAPRDLEVSFQAACTSSDDAVLLSQMLQAALLYQSFQSSSGNPAMAGLLDGLSVTPNGKLLDLSLDLTSDQIMALILKDSFAVGR